MMSEAAVEAAAKRLWYSNDELIEVERPDWDDALTLPVWRGIMDDTRKAARDILEAAAPHMLKSAYDLGFEHGSNEPSNPYRSKP